MLQALSAATMIACATGASATVLTFDDIPGGSSNTFGALSGTYHGFNFGATNNLNRMDWIDTVDSPWNFGAVSGQTTLLNNYGGSAIITAAGGSDFSFDGLYGRIWGDYQPARSVSIVGLQDGVVQWTENVTISSSWASFSGHAGSIDTLQLNFGDHFLIDNLALNEESAEVPLPSSLALSGLGLLGLLAARKRRR